MKYILEHENKLYLKFFEEISAIPRNSFQEEKISDYLIKFAQDRGLWWYRDDIWNVIIKKPAAKGYEGHAPVMLQGHTDMVCERIRGSLHNFEKDPLELYVQDGWIKAKGTTLGADCGDGVAMMLAVLDDHTLNHPPLEAFFSVQEESGIGGPRLVDYSQFTAKRIIATDIIWEGTTYESVSGAVGGDFIKGIRRESEKRTDAKPMGEHTETHSRQAPECSLPQVAYFLSVDGCAGGHSALNAAKCPANAIKVAARILYRLRREVPIRLVHMEGGSIRNNIAAHCKAVFACDTGSAELLHKLVKETAGELAYEYAFTDPGLAVVLEASSMDQAPLDQVSSDGVIEFLHTLPSGEYMRSPKYGNAVFASRNMGNILMKEDELIIGYMFRGTMKSQTADMMEQTLCLARRFDAHYEEEYRYSGYISETDTPLVNVWKDVYKEATGKDLSFLTMHGGTDVGTIIDNLGGMDQVDVIAIGPNAKYVHTTEETLELESYGRTYRYLTEILARI